MKRLRLLIYESDSRERMDKQIENSVHGTRIVDHRQGHEMRITAIDLDPRKILQLIRLFYREAATRMWQELDGRKVEA